MKHKNVSDLLREQAEKLPNKRSIYYAKKRIWGSYSYPSYTFSELNNRINKFCHKLEALGVKPKDKVLFFVKPNLDFCAITYALFRLGAIVIFIDPGMKRDYFFKAIKEVEPDVLLGIPKVHILRRFFKQYFSGIKIFITTGILSGTKAKSIYRGLKKLSNNHSSYIPHKDDMAAILYTSGGTGEPKGVEYTHDIFIQQSSMLKKEFHLTSDDFDIPCFPLFSFFTLSMGMSSCIPDMDPAKPLLVDPAKLYRNINETKATFLAGSPAIWDVLADYCLEKKLILPTVKYLVMFGAPVRVSLHKKLSKILINGTTYTPYGATECLPIANISGKDILMYHQKLILDGAGTCVGKALQGVNIKIIESTFTELAKIADANILGVNSVGEIIVNAPNMTKAYFKNDDATKKSKIKDGDKIWHRMGDVGYLDEKGNLWFCGRQKHVVEVKDQKYYPNQIETIFNSHALVSKSALIKDKKEDVPAIVIERKDHLDTIEPMFLMDLKNLAQTHDKTKNIQKFYVKTKFPVDVRHNIKIDRCQIELEINGES